MDAEKGSAQVVELSRNKQAQGLPRFTNGSSELPHELEHVLLQRNSARVTENILVFCYLEFLPPRDTSPRIESIDGRIYRKRTNGRQFPLLAKKAGHKPALSFGRADKPHFAVFQNLGKREPRSGVVSEVSIDMKGESRKFLRSVKSSQPLQKFFRVRGVVDEDEMRGFLPTDPQCKRAYLCGIHLLGQRIGDKSVAERFKVSTLEIRNDTAAADPSRGLGRRYDPDPFVHSGSIYQALGFATTCVGAGPPPFG